MSNKEPRLKKSTRLSQQVEYSTLNRRNCVQILLKDLSFVVTRTISIGLHYSSWFSWISRVRCVLKYLFSLNIAPVSTHWSKLCLFASLYTIVVTVFIPLWSKFAELHQSWVGTGSKCLIWRLTNQSIKESVKENKFEKVSPGGEKFLPSLEIGWLSSLKFNLPLIRFRCTFPSLQRVVVVVVIDVDDVVDVVVKLTERNPIQ